MRIATVETFTYWVRWTNWLLVKVTTDEGLHGWGEASLLGGITAVDAMIHELAGVLIGQEVGGVERHWEALYNANRYRGGVIINSAVAGLDIALWDIEGKRLGQPVYRLLGGPHRPKIRFYASHWMDNIETPEAAYERAKEAVQRGFTGFKSNWFKAVRLRQNEAAEISRAAALMAAAREGAGPNMEIFVDCGECFSPRTALLAAKALEPYRPGWFEEPISYDNPKEMVRLAQRFPVPIATGERLYTRWEYRELLEGGGATIIQPDLTHAAGISEVRRIATMAETYYVTVAPHNAGGPMSTLAAINLMAAIPNFYMMEHFDYEHEIRNKVYTNPERQIDGYLELPTEPGLGSDLTFDALEEKFRPYPLTMSSEQRWF